MNKHSHIDPSWRIPAKQAKHIIQVAERLGVCQEDAILGCGIEKKWLESPDYQMPVAPLYALNKHIATLAGNEDLGLFVGRAAYLNMVNLLLYLSSICTSLRQWLNMMSSVLELYGDLGKAVIVREGGQLRSEWRPLVPVEISGRYTIDMILSTANSILSTICLQPITIAKAQFTYPQPQDLTVLKQCFGENLTFDQPYSALYFQMESLDFKLIQAVNETSELTNPWQDYMASIPGDSFLNALRQSIVCELPTGDMNIDSVAVDLGVSRRTLQRRLADRETNFQHVVQELRYQMALRFLADKSMGVTSIAFILGYGDSSSFSTAFKSWHGCSPSEYRL
jgi:AraC-like DNA-binding protein